MCALSNSAGRKRNGERLKPAEADQIKFETCLKSLSATLLSTQEKFVNTCCFLFFVFREAQQELSNVTMCYFLKVLRID